MAASLKQKTAIGTPNHRPRKCLNWKTCRVSGFCCREISERTFASRFEGLWGCRKSHAALMPHIAPPIVGAAPRIDLVHGTRQQSRTALLHFKREFKRALFASSLSGVGDVMGAA